MAFIGLSIPSNQILPLINEYNGLIGLTFKPAVIKEGSPVVFDVNQVIFNSDVDINPVIFNSAESIEGVVYRENDNNGSPYLLSSENGVANGGDEFQFVNDTTFAFFSKDAISTLIGISSNLIFSGAAYNPGLLAYADSGIKGDSGSLKMEVDRTAMKILKGAEDYNKKIPAAIVGTPCPPNWNPF